MKSLFSVLFLFSCQKEILITNPKTNVPEISYSKEGKSIFVTHYGTSGCHDGGEMSSFSEYQVVKDLAAQHCKSNL